MLRKFCGLYAPFVLLVALGFAGCSNVSGQDTPFAAGTMPMSMNVPALPAPVPVQVWYPAPKSLGERQVIYTSAYWGHAKPKAAVSSGARFPLVVLAHGWGGTRFDLAWVAESLARQGFIVASFNAIGGDATSWSNSTGPKVWFRAHMMRILIDTIAQDERFASVVDTSSVAVVGHSAGGSAALVLGGAQIDATGFAQAFPQSAPVVEGNWSDPRIRAVIALNPGTGPAFSGDSVGKLVLPTLILSGSSDKVAPEKTNAQFYAEHLPRAEWHSLPDVNHYTFMSVCSVYARLRHFGSCIEDSPSVDRAAVHETSLTFIKDFLRRELAHNVAPAAPATP